MTTDNKAPSREYWLEIWTQNADEDMIEANCYHRKPKHWPKKPHGLQVHVIEKSAYDKLQQELDAARIDIHSRMVREKNLRDDWLEARKQLADLKAQIAEYEAALKEAAEWHRCDDVNGEAGRIAHETLNKWKRE